jgi:aerobic-type carbon monoxide dehydrogenase small subunit (CoxS/CutS family)
MSKPEQSAPGTSGFSRRAFLKGSGAAAAATAIGSGPGMAVAAAAPAVVAGLTTIKLRVNGKDQSVEVEPRTTLLEALRLGLNLTGAKPISVDGSSGGSTVLVDGKPVSANTVLAMECEGKSIQTVESLNPDGLPQAFAQHDASQCGFCTPGFVVAAHAFLAKHPQATEAEIRASLNGNLCRCGTYANIIPAVLATVKGGGNG